MEACPAESLSYVPWRDLTDKVPPRVTTTAVHSTGEIRGLPGMPSARSNEDRQSGYRDVPGSAVKGGRPFSVREFGFKWIDLVGTILLPLALVFVIVHAVLRKVVKR